MSSKKFFNDGHDLKNRVLIRLHFSFSFPYAETIRETERVGKQKDDSDAVAELFQEGE